MAGLDRIIDGVKEVLRMTDSQCARMRATAERNGLLTPLTKFKGEGIGFSNAVSLGVSRITRPPLSRRCG